MSIKTRVTAVEKAVQARAATGDMAAALVAARASREPRWTEEEARSVAADPQVPLLAREIAAGCLRSRLLRDASQLTD